MSRTSPTVPPGNQTYRGILIFLTTAFVTFRTQLLRSILSFTSIAMLYASRPTKASFPIAAKACISKMLLNPAARAW